MKAKEMRGKTPDELGRLEQELSEELFRLQLRNRSGQSHNPGRVAVARRELARVKMVRDERTEKQS